MVSGVPAAHHDAPIRYAAAWRDHSFHAFPCMAKAPPLQAGQSLDQLPELSLLYFLDKVHKLMRAHSQGIQAVGSCLHSLGCRACKFVDIMD